jgi:PAS domain S-box-containing protein
MGEGRLGLRTRIAVAITAICLASIVLVVTYLQYALERNAVEQWRIERQSDASVLAHSLDRTLTDLTGDLRIGTSLSAMGRLEPGGGLASPSAEMEKRKVLDALLGDGAFSFLFIARPDGAIHLAQPVATQLRLTSGSVAELAYFQTAKASRRVVLSDWVMAPDGRPGVVILVPRSSDGGAPTLYLGAVIHTERLNELFSSAIEGQFDRGMLLDRQGQLIASSAAQALDTATRDALAAAMKAALHDAPAPAVATTESFQDPHHDEEVLASFAQLAAGWSVALVRERSTFITETRPAVTRIALMVGSLLLLVGAIGFVIANQIVQRWEVTRRALAKAHDELEEHVWRRTRDLDLSRLELQRKSTALETILDNITQGISLYDANLTLLACNRRFIDLLDLPPELVRPGTSLEDYLRFNAGRGEYGACDADQLVAERILRVRQRQNARYQHVRPDGRILDVMTQVLPDGGIVTTYSDITDAKRIEENLRTLSRAVEQSPVSVVITDPDGAINYVNPKFVDVTGYSLTEVRGQNPRILKSGEIPEDTYERLWATILAGGTWEGDLLNKKKNGELFWERASISPIRSPDGTIIHFVAVKEDISQRKRFESDLLAAKQSADDANQAKTVFLSHMSHELRTPLTAVLGYAEMMDMRLAGELPAAYANYVKHIQFSGGHLLSIIDEVLDITRIELGSYRINRVDMDLAQVGRECVAMLRPQCEAKDITMTMTGHDVALQSDARAVRQIFINLLGNAVKYTDGGGRVDLVVERRGNQAVIVVSDTGCGISPDHLDHIFEPFQQADPLRADPVRGVGLGLAICRRVIELLDGAITLTSTVGQGTTVTVTLDAPPLPVMLSGPRSPAAVS